MFNRRTSRPSIKGDSTSRRFVAIGFVLVLVATILATSSSGSGKASAHALAVAQPQGLQNNPALQHTSTSAAQIQTSSGVLTRRTDVFSQSLAHTLIHRSYINGVWSGWEDLGGYLTSAPAAVSMGTGRLDVFARNQAGHLGHIWFDNGQWTSWEDLGGNLADAPAVTSWYYRHLDVLIRGYDNRIWHRAFADSDGWSGWNVQSAGTFSFNPAISTWGGTFDPLQFDEFARGQDGALWHAATPGSSIGSQLNWESLGGSMIYGPAAVSWGQGRYDVFARSATTNTLTYRTEDAGALFPWVDLGGAIITYGPTVDAFAEGHLDVFARAVDGTLLQKKLDGATWFPTIGDGWIHLGGYLASAPASVSWYQVI